MAEIISTDAGSLWLRLDFKPVTFMINGQAVTMYELGTTLPFARKPANLADFACGAPQRVFVHARRALTQVQFDSFSNRLCAATDWLAGTAIPVPVHSAHACVMVSAPERPVLFVDTQGYGYARYVARLA